MQMRLSLFFSVFFLLTLGNPSRAQSTFPPSLLSKENVILISSQLKEGDLGYRWLEGVQWGTVVKNEVARMIEPNHAKIYEGYDPIGVMFDFTAKKSGIAGDLRPDPISKLKTQLLQVSSIIGNQWFEIQRIPELWRDVLAVYIGIYNQAELSRGIALGQGAEITDLQEYIVSKALPAVDTLNRDTSGILQFFYYLTARFYNFEPGTLFQLANTFHQTAIQNYRMIEPVQQSMLIAAANYYAFGANSKGSHPRYYSFFSKKFAYHANLSNGIALANYFKFHEMETELLKLQYQDANKQGDWDKAEQIKEKLYENRLISQKPKILEKSIIWFWLLRYRLGPTFPFFICLIVILMILHLGAKRKNAYDVSLMHSWDYIKFLLDPKGQSLSFMDRMIMMIISSIGGAFATYLVLRADMISSTLFQ